MNVLEAQNLCFGYHPEKPILQDVTLKCTSNQRLALQAPSGFGKSTLCQLLAGYLTPCQGSITLNGFSLCQQTGKPHPVQLIWQHPEQVLDPYLKLGKSLSEAGYVTSALQSDLGIRPEWLDRYPHELSGGELQRMCLARALATKPTFIIADEISTMLDAVTQAYLWEFLLDYCKQSETGLIFVSHSPALTQRIATDLYQLDA